MSYHVHAIAAVHVHVIVAYTMSYHTIQRIDHSIFYVQTYQTMP